MIWIAHRGNVDGRNPDQENHPDALQRARKRGFDVELDVWWTGNGWALGHDGPRYEVAPEFLLQPGLWCHAKNIDGLARMVRLGVHCFWHQRDDVTLTSRGELWTFPGQQLTQDSICVMPERAEYSASDLRHCKGICSDRPLFYQDLLKSSAA